MYSEVLPKQSSKNAGYDKIKTFGAGRDRFASEWKFFIQQLINKGILAIDFGNYYRLKATPLAHEVIKGELKVEMQELLIKGSKPPAKEKEKAKTPKLFEFGEPDGNLLAKLKTWRLHKAKEDGMPPYIIMHDSVLNSIAAIRPLTITELEGVSGIGQHKIAKYGEALLRVVQENS
jgi:ATP-dependent DNA helicase RecQ